MSVQEIKAKSVLHHHDREFSTCWDLNLYRGCGHRCIYCFAQYSHKYLGTEEFFDDIFVKTNAPESLISDFSKRSWNHEPINLCGVTDAYQPLEAKYKLMPQIIEIFIKYKNPMVITTKSVLALRDLDLLDELNKVAGVVMNISASIINEDIRKKIEPFSSPTVARLKMIREFSKRNIRTEVLLMPVIPYISDDMENLDAIFSLAKANGACGIIPNMLHLRGHTKNTFFTILSRNFPDLVPKIRELYNGSYINREYAEQFREKIRFLRGKHNLYNNLPRNHHHQKHQCVQLKLL